jgi:DNA-binding transcriptional LysR family regulator
VCETLNFIRAAEQCNVTRPALTRAVQKLEEALMRPQLEQIWQQTEAAKNPVRATCSDR